MSNAARSAEFLTKFHSERDAITAQIEVLKAKSVTAQDVQHVASRLSQLSASMSGALDFLPAYDQRLCHQQVKDLETAVEGLRSKIPKARFAFKRKQPIAGESSQATSTTATPPPESTNAQGGVADISRSASSRQLAYISARDIFEGQQSASSDVTLSSLDTCIVNLVPSGNKQDPNTTVTALYARQLNRCLVLLGDVQGSVRFEDCVNCVVVLGCHQFRMEKCRRTDAYIHVRSIPVIEESQGIRFSSYPTTIENVSRTLSQESRHHAVKDFSWIRDTPSPNWSKLPEGSQVNWPALMKQLREPDAGKDVAWVTEVVAQYSPTLSMSGHEDAIQE
ncbi:hypothetical protein FRB99_007046 [Tulasnella sp. 403]|nr:hypothetical protein FRB99_007046 [Tulasnella sp. 403]